MLSIAEQKTAESGIREQIEENGALGSDQGKSTTEQSPVAMVAA